MPHLRKRSIDAIKNWLSVGTHRVIGFVTCEMGLMVKRGNPLPYYFNWTLARTRCEVCHRDPESGTRLLFDQILRQHNIDTSRITGYEQVEFTHQDSERRLFVRRDQADATGAGRLSAINDVLDHIKGKRAVCLNVNSSVLAAPEEPL